MDLLATATCIVALSLGLFAELGGCTPVLTHNRRSLSSTSPDRNIVDLFCREDGSETLAIFWNGNTQLNSIPSATHTHDLTSETEAGIVCRNEEGVSDEIRLAALPFDMEIQDEPLRFQCVRRGEEVQLPCEYPPGNLSELYTVQWRFRERGNDIVIVPPGFGPNNLPFDNLPIAHILSIDEDTFALTVAVEQTGNQFHCDVNVRRNDIGFATVRYIGATIELIVRDAVQIQIRKEASSVAVLVRDETQLQCVFDGDPAPSINWKLYGDEVENGSDSGRFLISNIALQIDCSVRVTSTFNIISTKVQDNGLVECEATNTNSEGTQSTAASNTSLTVLSSALDIFDRPTSEVVLENSATFICGARGLTTPEITWRLNDVDAQENENAVYERISSNDTTMIHQLTLNQVQDTDSGTITCVARITGSDVPVEQNTTLSVLTDNFDPEIKFINGGGLQVNFQLPAAIQDELRFRVKYITEINEEEQIEEQQIEGDFTNKQSIVFTIPSDQLPSSQFTLQIAMEVDGEVGDFTSRSNIITINLGLASSTLISVSVLVGVLAIVLVLIIAVVGVRTVRRRMNITRDNEHIYENISLYSLEMQYNMTSNDAYVPGTSASVGQQNAANTERQSSTVSHCSHEAVEGDEMRDGDDQPGSAHEHEQDAGVCYQAGDDYEQAQCYELAGGVYDQFKVQDYEQTSDPYERVQDYEQQQASGVYDQLQSYERLQLSDPYDQIQSYERLQVSDQVGDNEQLQATDQVQSYEQPQAHTVYHIQGYELVVQSRYCGLIQLKEI